MLVRMERQAKDIVVLMLALNPDLSFAIMAIQQLVQANFAQCMFCFYFSLCILFYFYFILFYFVLFCFILFYFVLFCFVLFYFILFYFILFLFYFILFYFILFYFILFYFIFVCNVCNNRCRTCATETLPNMHFRINYQHWTSWNIPGRQW
jgi:hypothetical protein